MDFPTHLDPKQAHKVVLLVDWHNDVELPPLIVVDLAKHIVFQKMLTC